MYNGIKILISPILHKYQGKQMKNRTSEKAFTLMELLVVISIIAMLMAILMPSLNRARQSGKTIRCMANLRNISTALEIYAENYYNLYPLATWENTWGTPNYLSISSYPVPFSGFYYSWMEQLYPYHESKEIYLCPVKPQNKSEFSYFLGTRAAWINASNTYASTDRRKIRHTTAFVMAGCTNYPFFLMNEPDQDDYSQNCIGYPVHIDAQNILFADSHINKYRDYDAADMTFRYEGMSAW